MEFVTTDKQITEIIIGKVRIRKGESYSSALQVLVETPFEEGERYRLTGKIENFPNAVTYHETKYDADSEGAKLEDAGATIEVERCNVLIDEDGKIVSAQPYVIAVPDSATDMPF